MRPNVSIVISTRNRRQEILRAIDSCMAQSYEPLEVLVYDDASTDGTAESVREQFPEVRLFPCEERAGYLVWRNQGLRDAAGEFVFSIDDDAYFIDPKTVSRVVELFGEHPEAAAMALPYVEPRGDRGSGRMRPLPEGTQLRSYTGCAHALRRQVVLELRGYRELLVHQGEERDLSLRMLDAGWTVVYADSAPLVHLYSPRRDYGRVNYFGYRNTLLFSSLNVPQPYVLPRMLLDSLQLLRYRFRLRTLPGRLRAVLGGWGAALRYLKERRPVRRATYRTFRRLPSHGPLTLQGGLPVPLRRMEQPV